MQLSPYPSGEALGRVAPTASLTSGDSWRRKPRPIGITYRRASLIVCDATVENRANFMLQIAESERRRQQSQEIERRNSSI